MSDTVEPHSSKRVFGLDLLRCLAILGVVWGHFADNMRPNSIWTFNDQINGLSGVELFFVLSGFLIGGIIIDLQKKSRLHSIRDLGDFWKRRWLRTLPNYYLFLGVNLSLSWGFIKEPVLHYFFFCQNLLWPMPGPFFGETWSLTIEEIFYLLFPLSVLIFSRSLKRPRLALQLSFLTILAISLGAACWMPFQSTWEGFDTGVRKVALGRVDSIMFGVVMVYIMHYHQRIWSTMVRHRFVLILPFLILNSWAFHNKGVDGWIFSGKFVEVMFYPLYSVTCACLLPLMASVPTWSSPLARPIVWISKVSYALYLCHLPTMAILNRYVLKIGWEEIDKRHDWFMLVYWISALLVASVVYIVWEKPWMSLRDRRFSLRATP